MGAVEILIVWENLEIMRYTLKNNSTNGMYILPVVKVNSLGSVFI